ncbi:MAG: RecX family transcriptional regulator [bacterium]
MESNALFEKVLRYVSIRPRSEKEVIDYIKKKLYKKYSSDEINLKISEITKALKDLNLLNDESFAKSFIEWRLESANPKGFGVIRGELFIKGIERELMDKLLDNEEYKDMEKEAIKKVISKKGRSYKDPRQLKNYLFSRGFSSGVIEISLEN